MMTSKLEMELATHRFVVVNTEGVSMRPLLQAHKTHVVLEQVAGALQQDDIALYRRADGALILHRVIKVADDHYLFRGDNCIGTERVSPPQVLAVVTKIYKNGRYILLDDKGYRRYVALWRWSYPIRCVAYWFRGKACGLKARWSNYDKTKPKDN